MKFTVPGSDATLIFESDRFTIEYTDGSLDSTPITPKMKRNAADTVCVGGGMLSGAAGLGIGSAIASLGSIGIAGLGTAVAVPLFPIIGGVAGVAAVVAGVSASISTAETINPS